MRLPIAAFNFICFCLTVTPPQNPASSREISIHTGKGPRFIAVADVNHDSHLDLIVANAESATLTILLGDGRGRFQPSKDSPIPSGPLPNDIAVADMNHDGHPDLVIANHQSPFITILLGDGKGGFHPAPGSPFDVHSTPHPHGLAVAPFTGAGRLDVVVDSWGNNRIELLEGDGRGGLRLPGRFFPVGRRPYERLRSTDFNHDGHPDIVTTNLDDDTATILLGDGKGAFREAGGSPFPAGPKPWQVAIDDFDGDGNADLAIIPYERDVPDPSQLRITLLMGDGKGGFKPLNTPSLTLTGCHGSNSIATGDFNGDHHRDIVVACAESKTLAIFFGHAGGGFTRQTRPSHGGWGSVTAADLNGDGKDDLIRANPDDDTITVYMSNE